MSILQGLIASIRTGSPPPGPYNGSVWAFSSDDLNHGSLGFDGWWTVNGSWMTPSMISGPTWNSYTYYDTSSGHTYDFNGTSDYLISPQLTATGAWPTNAITVQMWFYPTANGIQLLGELGAQDTSSLYHYSMLEIDSSNHIKAVFWNGTAATSTNTITLNQWNHVYFAEDTQGGHFLEVNGVPTNGNPVYTRTNPILFNAGYEYFVVGMSDSSNMGNSGRFQGKIGTIEIYDTTVGNNYQYQWSKFQPPPPESGTAGSSIVFQTDAPPASGTTWTATVGSSASINGSFSIAGSGSSSGVTLAGYSSSNYIEVPYNLNRGYWTVELVCELNPTGYWATPWGNDSWSAGQGYIAYLTSSGSLNVGSSLGAKNISVSDISSKAHWVFTNNGGVISVYKNGTQLSAGGSYTYPNAAATNNLYIGARHANNGVGPTDACAGTYYFIRVRDYALDSTGVSNAYNNDVKTLYSLP